MITIHQSDAVKWANEYEGPLFHALLCDPPYHLTSIVKRFGKDGSAPAQFGKDGAFSRASKGFMGKVWDGGDVAFDPAAWSAFMKVLHPGAFGMAFASSRGWHRLAVAIEDAGFVIHPTIFGWLYGSGFPKAHKVNAPDPEPWVGHRYGLQALKPALEPIIVFQKPYEGKPLDCMVETGAGALNIDGSRIPTQDILIPGGSLVTNSGDERTGKALGMFQPDTPNLFEQHPEGRWPANFILGDEGAANALDAQSGHLKSGDNCVRRQEGTFLEHGGLGKAGDVQKTIGDEGGASRFFFRVQEQIDESDPVYYCSKASKTERDEGLKNLPIQLFGQSGGAQSALAPGERTYQEGENISTGMNTIKKRHNPHPTLKPIALAKYLATLLLPPNMYAPRRLFVPFAGVASECIGAHQALWEEIEGIEMDEQYCEIARARVEYWEKKGVQLELFK